jgi:hypothetical protein
LRGDDRSGIPFLGEGFISIRRAWIYPGGLRHWMSWMRASRLGA